MNFPNLLPTAVITLLICSCNSAQKQNTLSAVQVQTIHNLVNDNSKTMTEKLTVWKKPVLVNNKYATKLLPEKKATTINISLSEDFKTIEPGFQNFIINPDTDTAINCKWGTIIRIKKNSFVNCSTLEDVKSGVHIQVKEFYKIADIISARLSTQSDENILETGGTLFIQAFSEGQECKLKENSAVELAFPFLSKKEGMLLFNGNWINGKLNWSQGGNGKNTEAAIVDEVASFPGGNVALKKFLNKNIVYPDTLADTNIGGSVIVDFTVDETGKVQNVSFKSGTPKAFKDAIETAFEKMPLWKPAQNNGIPVESGFSQTITFYSNEGPSSFDTLFKKEFEAYTSDKNLNNTKIANIREYIFSTSKLGWINCDRFYNSPAPKTNFFVDCGPYDELDIKLVFHSFKSVLDNYASKFSNSFKNIPDNEVVTIVAVKKYNNETFVSVTESNTGVKVVNSLAFEKATIAKLKEKLEKINSAW